MDTSVWLSDVTFSPAPSLDKDMQADVVIIGSGLTGVTSAYLLSQTDKKVVVIDKGDISSSVTAYTTAFLTYLLDTPLSELINLFGQEKAELIWRSHNKAIDTIENIVIDEKIDCEFTRCSEFLYAHQKSDLEILEKEYEAAKKCGLRLILHNGEQTSFTNLGYLEFPKQAKFHPLKYLLALRAIAQEHGVKFFDRSEALSIKGTDPVAVTTAHGSIIAQKAIVATYDPFNHPPKLFAKKGMYKSYVLEGHIPKDQLAEGLYLDTQNPYHYTRVDKKDEYDRLIIGGEDHRIELPVDEKKSFSALSTYLKEILPEVQFEKKYQWTGPILEPTDGIAYIGKMDESRFVAMAFSGNGMTYATIAGIMARDFVQGHKNAWEDLYDPLRLPTIHQLFSKGKDYVEEFFGGAVKNTF